MFKIASVELTKSEVSQIKDAIHDMDLGIFLHPVQVGYDIVSDFYGDMMDLFDLICFELNLIEEDIVEF